MIQRYELLLLTVPEITYDEVQNLERQLEKFIQDVQGTVLSFEKWGKFKLAYPVRKNDYGVYILIRFEVPEGTSIMHDLRTYFVIKLGNLVMRDMISSLDIRKPLAYQRPRSLEEIPPSREVGVFFKEPRESGAESVEAD